MTRTNPPSGRTRMRSTLLGFAALALAASATVASTASASPGKGNGNGNGPKGDRGNVLVDLQVLAFNDYHGHIEADTPGSVDGSRNGPAGGGSEYLSAKLTELRAGHENTLTVAAGDLIGGSTFLSGVFHDEPSVESLNAMGLDVSGVGNHEFDEGVTELLRMQNGGCHPVDGCYFPDQPYAGADFPWLAANVVNEATGETPLPPYWIKKVGGIKVGFIGMTLEATDTLVAQAGIRDYDFRDEVDTANALVPELRSQGVRAIVVLLHEGAVQTGTPADFNICSGISGPAVQINSGLDPAIDILITGHTHAAYNCELPDPSGQMRRVTSAFSFGRVVSEFELVLDKRTRDIRRDLSTATNHQVIQTELTPDPALTAVIAKWKPLGQARGEVVVGEAAELIARASTGGREDRGLESAAGNLIADAQLAATAGTAGAELALMNPGGIRADIDPGPITYADAFNVQPFSNSLQTFEMTGAQIQAVLEQQCQPIGSSRPFLHLGVSLGLTYDLSKTIVLTPIYNSSGSQTGTRLDCIAVSVANVVVNGAPLDPNVSYTVTVNNFLADGGDNFTVFAEASSSGRVGGGIDLDALIDYLGANNPVSSPGTNRVNEM